MNQSGPHKDKNWPEWLVHKEGPESQDQTGPKGQYIRTKLVGRASTSGPNEIRNSKSKPEIETFNSSFDFEFQISISSFDFEFQIRVTISGFAFEFETRIGNSLRASLVLTGQNRFYYMENRQCSIFGTSKNGFTPNLTSNSDSLIYPKTGQKQFFIRRKCRKPAVFYFSNIKKQLHTTSNLKFGFPVLYLA